jgi:hypothetical protein
LQRDVIPLFTKKLRAASLGGGPIFLWLKTFQEGILNPGTDYSRSFSSRSRISDPQHFVIALQRSQSGLCNLRIVSILQIQRFHKVPSLALLPGEIDGRGMRNLSPPFLRWGERRGGESRHSDE